MKTTILSLIAMFTIALGTTNSTYASTVKDDTYTLLNDVSTINKIEVHGNVELYISDASSDQVKVYNKYYAESALVQSKNGVLRISSYKAEKLVVWVSAYDLRAISAYDNATVKSFGNMSKIDLNVDLHDNAKADLNLVAYNITLTVKDNAKADLKGSADELTLNRSIEANVKSNNFAVIRIVETKNTFTAGIGSQVVGM